MLYTCGFWNMALSLSLFASADPMPVVERAQAALPASHKRVSLTERARKPEHGFDDSQAGLLAANSIRGALQIVNLGALFII
jgi:hypothetical protein